MVAPVSAGKSRANKSRAGESGAVNARARNAGASNARASNALASNALASKLNWLRAAVLGANDGIVSTAGLVFGVAGATSDHVALLIAGIAAVVAGALSMAGGEYVSVSSQRDTEQAALAAQSAALLSDPAGKLAELAEFYAQRGMPQQLATKVAEELTAHDALEAHARTGLGIDAGHRTSPASAAVASMLAFAAGAVIPLASIVMAPTAIRLPATVAAVLVALGITGVTSARLGGAPVGPAVIRNVVVGSSAMAITYAVGSLVGHLVGAAV
ncbi:MAG: VIT1/CCC1 transporter family protein [Candidatus Nanopelagicales bacterium]